MTTTAILFDIGGVLVALNGVPSLARLMKREPSHEEIHGLWMRSPSVVAHETGKMSLEDFGAGVVRDLSLPCTPAEFLDDFCNWPRTLLPGALELLDHIPRGVRTAALSNTSAAHWERITAMGLADRFDGAFLSHETGFLKPSLDAFNAAVQGLALPPQEILFFDDGRRNIAAARALGLRAHLVSSPAEAWTILENDGVIARR